MIFMNSFILYGAVIMFMDIIKDIPNLQSWTQDERIGLYILLTAIPLVAAVNIETIIKNIKKIWTDRR